MSVFAVLYLLKSSGTTCEKIKKEINRVRSWQGVIKTFQIFISRLLACARARFVATISWWRMKFVYKAIFGYSWSESTSCLKANVLLRSNCFNYRSDDNCTIHLVLLSLASARAAMDRWKWQSVLQRHADKYTISYRRIEFTCSFVRSFLLVQSFSHSLDIVNNNEYE